MKYAEVISVIDNMSEKQQEMLKSHLIFKVGLDSDDYMGELCFDDVNDFLEQNEKYLSDIYNKYESFFREKVLGCLPEFHGEVENFDDYYKMATLLKVYKYSGSINDLENNCLTDYIKGKINNF